MLALSLTQMLRGPLGDLGTSGEGWRRAGLASRRPIGGAGRTRVGVAETDAGAGAGLARIREGEGVSGWV